jgi:hypothetical protein
MTIDFAAFLGWLLPVVFSGMYIFLLILGRIKTGDFTFTLIYAAVSVIALGLLLWRIQLIRGVFSDGIETTATINSISFFRDRGRVEYIYMHEGKKYAGGNAVHKVKQTEALQVGQQVVVVIDRSQPKQAFIRDLYM